MKKVSCIVLAIIALCLCLLSCRDDDNEKLNPNFLKQTKWTGTFVSINDGKIDFEDNVNLYFTTENRGSYSFSTSFVSSFNFNYIVDDKLLNIKSEKNNNGYVKIMTGDWILTEMKNDKLSFTKGIVSDENYCIMKLTKR